MLPTLRACLFYISSKFKTLIMAHCLVLSHTLGAQLAIDIELGVRYSLIFSVLERWKAERLCEYKRVCCEAVRGVHNCMLGTHF